ncbi:MAG: sucrose-phosphate phosphatase-like hydrolase, archaeal [halophilic archaeon J07HX5]|nr:MAG: sucrose-phosphate phosphatase-like hydrolase, archaeal [halophilic archaeon J07HX5]
MDVAAGKTLADRIPATAPPLAVDIDGTLTDDQRSLDPCVMPVLRAWPAPVVIATGKAMPYPVALCEFLGIETAVVAENGGVVAVEQTDTLHVAGAPEAADAVAKELVAAGQPPDWGSLDLVNRWRKTELAVPRTTPLAPLEGIAERHGLVVVDTGFAYHVKSPAVSKGDALETAMTELNVALETVVAIGDSANDVSAFEAVGRGIAVANADDHARAAADLITDASYAAGFLEAVATTIETTA